ncbi:MAG: Holliday junction resolvase RuvX [Bacteroidales bacterium]
MGKIIALDYGKKRIGIASTDELQLIANALTTLSPSDTILFLKSYLSSENVDEIVVGNPINLNGKPAEAAEAATQFVKQLEKSFPKLKISQYDERFTSKMAQRTILEMGVKKMARRQKETIDKISACIILQSYMEYKRLKICKI